MKKTQHITLGLLAGMALAFTTGCNRRTAERRNCVDETGSITSEQNCQMVEDRRRSGYIGPMPYYHYLYGGSSGGHLGDRVVNGNPMPGMSTGSGSSGFFGGISRGGFGSTGSGGHGGSGGE
jgi:hypothetical protein